MRKVIFIDTFDEIKKLMIYESEEGVYLFGYDCVQDTVSIWDNWYLTLEEAEDFCEEKYQVDKEKWIDISEPLIDCQHDLIMPTKIVGKEIGNPQKKENQLQLAGDYLLIGDFTSAGIIADKYLAKDNKDVEFIFIKLNIEMALGNVDKMKEYEKKILAIDPKAFDKEIY